MPALDLPNIWGYGGSGGAQIPLHKPLPSPTQIKWTQCPASYPLTVDCGQLSVPVNHNDATDGQIVLGMVRVNATSSSPLGNLVFNPGGPGASAVTQVLQQTPFGAFSKNLTEHYNIIAPDPRGVGLSHPVQCDPDLFNSHLFSYVTTQEEFDDFASWNQALGQSCAKMTGPVFHYLDTASAAKDLDLIRQGLGDEKLNYVGFSYGTQLGSQYAELFPQNIGRMILDGMLDHSQTSIDSIMTEAVTLEDSFRSAANWCNTTSECALYQQDLPSIFDKLVDEANEKPIPAPGCVGENPRWRCRANASGYDLIHQSASFLASKGNWAAWARALVAASNGNATFLSSGLAPSDKSSTSHTYSLFSHTGITCQDWERLSGPRAGSDMIARLMAARALAPHTRGVTEMYDVQMGCVGWPAAVTNPPAKLNKTQMEQAPPILVVNALHDPSTSVVWSLKVRDQMPTAISIFRNGFGHTSYIERGTTQRAMDEFLISGKLAQDLTIFDS